MKSGLKAGALAGILSTLILVSPARADGDSRPATDAEKAFYQRVFKVLAAAVPDPGPDGWQVVERTEPESMETVGVGAENEPFWVSFTVAWQNSAVKRAAEDRMLAAGAAVAARQEAAAPAAADMARIEKLAATLGAAVERGDMAAVQRLQKEMEALSAQIEPVYARRSQEIDDEIRRHEVHDVQAEIRLMANALSESFMAPFSEADPVAGQKVYRTDGDRDPGGAWHEGVSFVFLGAGWQLNGDGEDAYMEAVPAAGRPHTTVQTVLVQVQADEKRARDLLARIDWKALKGLIGH